MAQLVRCQYCGVLQDEPAGAKTCIRCGGELAYEAQPAGPNESYVQAQMELDQVSAPAGRNFDRYLLITLRTPAEVPASEAAPNRVGRPPLFFSAVLDISGSMRGEKLPQAKEAVRQALRLLHEGDGFSLVTFNDKVNTVIGPFAVDDQTARRVEAALQKIQAGGYTALCGGLEAGIGQAGKAGHETRLVLLLSDGQANVGETDLELIGGRSSAARSRGMLVSTLGVGTDYNEAPMAEIATQGGGRFYHVAGAEQIAPYMAGELGEVAALAARDTVIELAIPSGATVVPLSAAYATQQGRGRAGVSLGDLPSDMELEVPLRLTLPAQLPGAKVSIEGVITYRSPAGRRLSTPLNRVTLRIVAAEIFGKRDGVVAPVVERVLDQMKAGNVLGFSRTAARGGPRWQADAEVVAVREYASLLGDEQAAAESAELQKDFATLRSAPSSVTGLVDRAFAVQRSTKKFDKR
jgi:Ca-activated chloride channel family protein